jgi:hypothetical protein
MMNDKLSLLFCLPTKPLIAVRLMIGVPASEVIVRCSEWSAEVLRFDVSVTEKSIESRAVQFHSVLIPSRVTGGIVGLMPKRFWNWVKVIEAMKAVVLRRLGTVGRPTRPYYYKLRLDYPKAVPPFLCPVYSEGMRNMPFDPTFPPQYYYNANGTTTEGHTVMRDGVVVSMSRIQGLGFSGEARDSDVLIPSEMLALGDPFRHMGPAVPAMR